MFVKTIVNILRYIQQNQQIDFACPKGVIWAFYLNCDPK